MNLLARREHSAAELLQKLITKQFQEESIRTVLAMLSNEGLLNEHRFTESFIHHRREKGLGPLRIQAELKERGISDDLIESALKISDPTWHGVVHAVWKKRFKNHIPSDYKTRVKQMRFLQYRGFTQEQISSLFCHTHELD